jgi:hypothetical protein
MRNLIVIFLVFFISCNKNDDRQLELEILSKSIVSLKNKDNLSGMYENMKDSELKKSKTIIVYKLTNYSSSSYYFNLNPNSKHQGKFEGISLKNGDLCIYQNDNSGVVKINNHRINPNFDKNDCYSKNLKISKFLGYPNGFDSPYLQEQLNFIIHPHETLFFEWFVNLPYGNEMQHSYVELDKNKKYYAEIVMFSDSVNYVKSVSRTTLKTIKENNYKIFHGIIKSKNKIPIKFVE